MSSTILLIIVQVFILFSMMQMKNYQGRLELLVIGLLRIHLAGQGILIGFHHLSDHMSAYGSSISGSIIPPIAILWD